MHPASDRPAIECHAPPGRADHVQRRIGAARLLCERLGSRAAELEPQANLLERLAQAIEEAEYAAWALANARRDRQGPEAGLRRAMEALRREQDALERTAAHLPGRPEVAAMLAPAVCRGSRWRHRKEADLQAAIMRARRVEAGGVELTILCHGLGLVPGLYVQVLRRNNPGERYLSVGRAWEPCFVDADAGASTQLAVYRVIACYERVSGPISRRVLVPLPRAEPQEPPPGWNRSTSPAAA